MKLQKIWYIFMTKEQKIWNIFVNIDTPKIISFLTSRQIKNQLDKTEIRSKKLLTKQSQIKTNKKSQIPKIYSYYHFLYIVDETISSIENRFEQFQIYEDIFGFLFNFTKLKSLIVCKNIILILNLFSNMMFIMILMV